MSEQWSTIKCTGGSNTASFIKCTWSGIKLLLIMKCVLFYSTTVYIITQSQSFVRKGQVVNHIASAKDDKWAPSLFPLDSTELILTLWTHELITNICSDYCATPILEFLRPREDSTRSVCLEGICVNMLQSLLNEGTGRSQRFFTASFPLYLVWFVPPFYWTHGFTSFWEMLRDFLLGCK